MLYNEQNKNQILRYFPLIPEEYESEDNNSRSVLQLKFK